MYCWSCCAGVQCVLAHVARERLCLEFILITNWSCRFLFSPPGASRPHVNVFARCEAIAAKNVADGPSSKTVWTAAFAEWGIPASYGLGPCDPSNVLTQGYCGPVMSATCTATWAENTLGLNLIEDNGYCFAGSTIGMDADKEYCPVFDGLNEAEFATCVQLWSNTGQYSAVSPALQFDDDGSLSSPIK